jgi:hypothetical protein
LEFVFFRLTIPHLPSVHPSPLDRLPELGKAGPVLETSHRRPLRPLQPMQPLMAGKGFGGGGGATSGTLGNPAALIDAPVQINERRKPRSKRQVNHDRREI